MRLDSVVPLLFLPVYRVQVCGKEHDISLHRTTCSLCPGFFSLAIQPDLGCRIVISKPS